MYYRKVVKISDDKKLTPYPIGENIIQNIPIAQEFANALKNEFNERDIVLVCMGSSGAILATLVATYLPNVICILHLKKDGEFSHSFGGYLPPSSFHALNIIIDDSICTGATLMRTYKQFKLYNPESTVHGLIVSGGYTTDVVPDEVEIETLFGYDIFEHLSEKTRARIESRAV